MSNDPVFNSVDDELSSMNVSEEDAIMKGLDDLDKSEEQSRDTSDEQGSVKEEKKPTYKKEDLLKIFDTILFEGEFRETVKLGKNYTIKFRTRTVGESNDITRKVDALDLKTFLAVQNFTNVITLAYAICEINNKNLMDLKFEEKYKLIKQLPEGLIVVISSKLFDFDQKVMAAMKEGQENF